MLKISILALITLISSCSLINSDQPETGKILTAETANNTTTVSNVVDADPPEKHKPDAELTERIRKFYDLTNETEDKKFLKHIFASPRGEIINTLAALQETSKNDYELQAKTAYLLHKLNHDEERNRIELIKLFSIYNDTSESKFSKLDILTMIGDILKSNDKDGSFLNDAFDLVNVVDGAYAESFSGIMADEFKKNPEVFLVKLKSKSVEVVEKVIPHLFYAERKEVILKRLDGFSKSAKVNDLIEQIRDFAKNN